MQFAIHPAPFAEPGREPLLPRRSGCQPEPGCVGTDGSSVSCHCNLEPSCLSAAQYVWEGTFGIFSSALIGLCVAMVTGQIMVKSVMILVT